MARPTSSRRRRWCVLVLVVAVACSGEDALDAPTTTAGSVTTQNTPPSAGDDLDLDDTSWRLVALVDEDGSRSAASGEVPAVVGFNRSRVEGYDGVDTAVGSYELDGRQLSIDLEEVSELGPSPDPGPEQLLFELLGRVDSVELDRRGELVLHHESGSLRFEPVGGGVAD